MLRKIISGIMTVSVVTAAFFTYKAKEKKQETAPVTKQQRNHQTPAKKLAEIKKAEARKRIRQLVIARKGEGTRRLLGGLKEQEVFVQNGSSYEMNEVEVIVFFCNRKGKRVDHQIIQFEHLPPHGELRKFIEDNHRGRKIECEVSRIVSEELNLK